MRRKERLYLAEAVAKRKSYICGYRKPFAGKTIMRWWDEHQKHHTYGIEIQDVFKKKERKKRKTYLGSIQLQFPDFLHRLYRYATKTLGHNACNYKIRKLMMEKAKVDFKDCPVRGKLKITSYGFRTFFNNNRGYYTKLSSKPRLSKSQMKERVQFCEKYLECIKKTRSIITVF